MNSSRQEGARAMRSQLIERSANLLSNDNSDALGVALRRFFPGLKHAFVINWIPDQAEDIYWVLIGQMSIAQIEIVRGDGANSYPPKLRMVELSTYQNKRHSRDVRERLAMALELIKSLS
ncbi:hypothetical protein [Burkholderia sp. Bp9004]|uniref:hypothetical protein n=1 Tax=Burkholderia sp. Bp9004 TaxID=2184559 RepID=UPI000F5DBCA8|nr:hypothetical protein [Burkholderia sp. Bp9004]